MSKNTDFDFEEYVRNLDRISARNAAELASEKWWHMWARGFIGAAAIWGLAILIHKFV